MVSIFEDTFYNAPASASPFDYSMETEQGEPVFRGRAYCAPDENEIRINMNRIAQDYLSIDFPDLSLPDTVGMNTTVSHPLACRGFVLRDEDDRAVAAETFLLDWSYEPKDFRGTVQLSSPINDRGQRGMFYFNTVVRNGIVSTTYGRNPLGRYEEGNYCGGGALYYLSRSGGWCSYLVQGNIRRVDDYQRYDITMKYSANSLEWGKKTYNNQITPSWELNTGWVNDSQSANIAFNLLSSNQVFFHDFATDKVWPVVITDNSAQYKTFVNNGRRMINHTINIRASHTQQNIS